VQGLVRAREEITLNAQVSARVMRVSPEFEDGAFFSAGARLVELEPDDFRTAVAMAEAHWRGAGAARQLAQLNHRRDLEMLKDRLLPEAQADVTKARLAQAEAAAAAAAAQLDRARRDLERTKVRAPFNGCVRRRMVSPGQLVGSGTTLGTVFATDRAEVRLPVAGRDLRFLTLPGDVGARGRTSGCG
jgi:RND family efflux transporter MFP subunit